MELFLEADYSRIKKTSIVYSEVYPIVEKQMKAGKWSAVKREIGRYITSHHEELYAPAPYTRIVFGNTDYEAFWKAFGVSNKQMEK